MGFNLVQELKNTLSKNQVLVIDRFEENFAVCERQDNGKMVDIERNLIPEDAIEGMTIKQSGDKYVIDYENCIVTRKAIVDMLKSSWEKEEGAEYYIVSSVLDTAVKCTNIFIRHNIYIKDEEVISRLKKGDIVKLLDEQYVVDEEKNLEVENEIQKLL